MQWVLLYTVLYVIPGHVTIHTGTQDFGSLEACKFAATEFASVQPKINAQTHFGYSCTHREDPDRDPDA